MNEGAQMAHSSPPHREESGTVPLKTAERVSAQEPETTLPVPTDDLAPIHAKASAPGTAESTVVWPLNSSDPWQVKEPVPIVQEDEYHTDNERSPVTAAGATTKSRRKRRKKRKDSRYKWSIPVAMTGALPHAVAAIAVAETSIQASGLSEQTLEHKPTTEHMASTLPQTVSSSIYERGNRLSEPVSQAVRVMLLGGAVAAFLLCVIIVAFLNHPPRVALVSNTSDWCSTSKSCRGAREFLQRTIDPSRHPCRNFYSHVCSKWTKKNKFFAGYLDELLHKLRTDIYDQLDDIDNSVNRELPQALSIFFKSCYEFITQKGDLQLAIDHALEAFEINSSRWKALKTLGDTIPDVARMSLVMGVPTAFNLSYTRGSTIDIYMDVGATLTGVYGQGLDDKLRTYLRHVLGIIATSHRDMEAALFDVDAKLAGLYAHVKNADFEPMPANKLQAALKTSALLPAINQSLPLLHVTEKSTVNVRGLGTIQNALQVLTELASYERNTYLLSLVISNILVQDYRARYFLNSTGEQTECLRITSKYFSPVFYQYVVESFQSYSVESELAAMEASVRKLTSDHTRTSPWIAVSRRTQVTNTISNVRVWIGKLKNRLTHANFYHFLSNSFAKNVVLLLKARAERQADWADNITLPLSQWEFTGAVGFIPEYKMIVASAAILQPDAFYDDPGTRINYGTVGALLAESFVLAGLAGVRKFPSGEEKEARALYCYQSRIEKETGSREGLKELVALKLALNITYYINRHSSEASKESDQIFFRRFCLSSCGSSSGHRVVLPGHIRCNLPLLGLQEFAGAFDCPVEHGAFPCEEPEWQ